jgi:hypothetical protein
MGAKADRRTENSILDSYRLNLSQKFLNFWLRFNRRGVIRADNVSQADNEHKYHPEKDRNDQPVLGGVHFFFLIFHLHRLLGSQKALRPVVVILSASEESWVFNRFRDPAQSLP